MILLPHLLLGAAIGQNISNPYIAIILAFLSHYILDTFPHAEYDFGIRDKKYLWQKMLSALRVATDLTGGILLILLFSKNQPIIYICAFFAILPDGFTVLNNYFQTKILRPHQNLHEKIHFLKHKKISNFWRILSQIVAVVISITLLRL